ncbi:MAG: metallophosphatase family protein [Chromatiales bacterium]|nr:metallophosphatase family protein [Chromatiales bacterium]
MSQKIGLISDPHADPQPVAEALEIFRQQGVTAILCAGDIAGYNEQLDETIELLERHQVKAIRGNHEVWSLERENFSGSEKSYRYLDGLADHLTLTLEGVSLYMVHAEPPDQITQGLRLLDPAGDVIPSVVDEWNKRLGNFAYDVLILGHTHQVYDIILGSVLVINPGSTAYNHSCAILTLPQMRVEYYPLGGNRIKRTWNWSELHG